MFRAYDSTRERLVAVKLFKLDLPPERGHQLVAEFEKLIAAEFAHPALAAPLATGISGVHAFLVQDYVAADSLDLAIREYGPAPAANALRVAAQLAGALDFAAAVQVTHGALHPRDVLLSSDDTRLTGLGITRALAQIGVVAPVRRPYTAPERLAGGDWDRRADVFGLAAMMHELLWGRRVSGLGAQAVESLTAIPGTDLAALRAVFARALAEAPADRFPTALEFAEALKDACPDVVIAPPPAPKRRAAAAREAVREIEPRLPLDEGHDESVVTEPVLEPQAVVESEPPAPVPVAPAPLPVAPAPAPVAQGFSPAEPAIASAEPELVYQPEPVHDAPTPAPAGLITGPEPELLSALERSRSALWPIALALVVGIAIGFAAGYGVGWRESSTAVVAVTPPAAAPATPAREFTETPVAAAPSASAGTANTEPRTPNPEPRNLKSEIRNLKSPLPEGRLLVRSRPEGAVVSVDGRDYGRTPVAVRELAHGAHRVKIVHDGYAAEERRIVISASRPAQTMTVALSRSRGAATAAQKPAAAAPAPERFDGALVVESRPSGAKVYVDGTFVGATPVSLPSVPAGSHAVRLEHDGYRRWTSSVRVVATEQNRVTASLER